jgi:hypothetical protein
MIIIYYQDRVQPQEPPYRMAGISATFKRLHSFTIFYISFIDFKEDCRKNVGGRKTVGKGRPGRAGAG